MTRRRTRYYDRDRAAALAAYDANGGRLELTAREIGVPPSTLSDWVADRDAAAPPDLRAEKTEELDLTIEGIVRRMLRVANITLDELGDQAIPIRDLPRLMTAVGILVDKMRVLRNLPTGRIAVEDVRQRMAEAGVTEDEMIAEVNAIIRGVDTG